MVNSENKKSDRLKFLGRPPLVEGDNEQDYNALYQELECYMKPNGFMDDLRVRELTDTIWEEQRHKSYQSKLIESAFHRMLIQVLTQIHMTDEWLARTDADKFFGEDAEERETVLALLRRFNIDIEMISAMAMSSNAASIALLERMQNNRKSCRSKILRDHELRQAQIDKADQVLLSSGSAVLV